MLTHVTFWAGYYVFFSLLWSKGNLFASFQLELVLMPIRIAASYVSLYYLIPTFLSKARIVQFTLGYLIVITLGGLLQRVLTFYFHEYFFPEAGEFYSLSAIARSIVLVNSAVLFLSALKVYKLWMEDRRLVEQRKEQPLEIRSEKRFYKVLPSSILYVEGLGNYLTIYLEGGKSLISYMSLKEAENILDNRFSRLHKSFIINKDKVESYNNENVEIGGRIIPIGKSYQL